MSTSEGKRIKRKAIYDPRKALEHVQTLKDVTPIRLFAILFPLWDIETTAVQEEARPYELMERYVERGIDEGQLRTVEELVAFLGLQSEMVNKILSFLETLGHVKHNGTNWEMTSLGRKSVKDGKSYVEQEKRIRFYFDAYTSKPLRTEHYKSKDVHIFAPEEANEIVDSKTWGYRFYHIASMHEWQSTSLRELEARVDRADYNMPPEMRGIQAITIRPAYIPMYIIETASRVSSSAPAQGRQESRPYYLVFTGIRELQDTHFEQLINSNAMAYAALRGEKAVLQANHWQDWLQQRGVTGVPLERPDGTWQISLPVSAFLGPQAKFATTRIGDYDLRDGYFIQIWCDDRALRRKAALDRTLRMIKNQRAYIKRKVVQEQMQMLASQLQIADLRFDELRRRALETEMKDIITVLDNLQQL